ncbi:MAG: hypothetical protein Q7S22_08755 [Candidatus Micrarchaeota archaeon]|nr:hypothetical protein [Candidatus Micrarchaeota archaeon]
MTRLHLGQKPKIHERLKSAGRVIAEFASVFRSLDYHIEGLRRAEKERSNSVPTFDSQRRMSSHLKIILSNASFKQLCDLLKEDCSENVQNKFVDELKNRYNAYLEGTVVQLAHSASRLGYIPFERIPIEVRAALNGSENQLTYISRNCLLVGKIRTMNKGVTELIQSGKLSEANSKVLTEMLAKPTSFYATIMSNWVATTPYGTSA